MPRQDGRTPSLAAIIRRLILSTRRLCGTRLLGAQSRDERTIRSEKIELGQIAIVAVLFPLLFLLRKQSFYVPVVLKGVSALLILVSGWWFVQRAFGLE